MLTLPTRVCEASGCDRPHFAKGGCKKHYQRLRSTGSFDGPEDKIEARFWAKVLVRSEPTACWLWTAACDSHGYGAFRNRGAHRWAYEFVVGPIPEGKHLDHECHNADEYCPGGKGCVHRKCVNPLHLNPIEPTLNQFLSGRSPVAINAAKTHCLRGHEFAPENTWINTEGRRVCLACKRGVAHLCSANPANASSVQ